MKRGKFFLGILTIIFLSQFVSADLFGVRGLESEWVLLGAIFLILFGLFYYSTARIFKKRDGTSNTKISLVISASFAIIVIWFVNKTNFSIGDSLSSLGLPTDLIISIATIAVIAGIIWGIIKMKATFFLLFGALITLVGIVADLYESGLVITLGVIIFGLGVVFKIIGFFRGKKKQI